MCFGDALQSIYAFRGADANSFYSLAKLRPSWHHLPLTLTFRCPKLIVHRQQSHAMGFRAAETNLYGSFTQHSETWNISPSPSIAVICRNNAPLLSLAFKLLRNRIPVTFLGKDIGKSLISLFNKICPEKTTPISLIPDLIHKWEEKEKEFAKDEPQKINNISDRAACLLAITDADCLTAREFLFKLENIFNGKGEITLTTVHRAKGLEWDKVYHLDPWRLDPERLLSLLDKGKLTAEQYQQERNANYVLETRTKNVLIEAPVNLFSML
jgi:superfamily I DNA/RNA helicase